MVKVCGDLPPIRYLTDIVCKANNAPLLGLLSIFTYELHILMINHNSATLAHFCLLRFECPT